MDGDIINKWIDDSLNDSLSIENINSDDEYIPSPDDSNSEEDCILSPNPKRRRLCKRLFDADDTDKTSSEAQTNNTDPALENEGSYSSVCDVSPTVNQSGKINRSLVPYSETESEKDSTSDELTPMKEKKKLEKDSGIRRIGRKMLGRRGDKRVDHTPAHVVRLFLKRTFNT
ncbi:hypothetical protein J6590_042403 [Homalodisca vitripennis]|nr:hypothetical protein J6590_078421 [Homalodisca vitripennis]KAG8311531.1 hypothetical protein J6590_042403 [Homalodisca vitripennis]